MVGGGGFEPPTSSVSGKRSPPELTALGPAIVESGWTTRRIDTTVGQRRGAELNRCAGFCRPLPNHSATPPGVEAGRTGLRRAPQCTDAPEGLSPGEGSDRPHRSVPWGSAPRPRACGSTRRRARRGKEVHMDVQEPAGAERKRRRRWVGLGGGGRRRSSGLLFRFLSVTIAWWRTPCLDSGRLRCRGCSP